MQDPEGHSLWDLTWYKAHSISANLTPSLLAESGLGPALSLTPEEPVFHPAIPSLPVVPGLPAVPEEQPEPTPPALSPDKGQHSKYAHSCVG